MILDLVHGLTASERDSRERAADEVTDVHRSLSADDIAVLAHVLVAARLVEADRACQESQLHALAVLDEWYDLPPEAIGRLQSLEAPTDDPSQLEYLRDLV
jgi:hypothetical protein